MCVYWYLVLLYFLAIGQSRPTMKVLNKHVIPRVSTKWYDLGLELIDDKYETELETIRTDYRNDGSKMCCQKMFSKWLETRDDASWDHIIEAMRNIELNSVASDVEQLLVQGECMVIP